MGEEKQTEIETQPQIPPEPNPIPDPTTTTQETPPLPLALPPPLPLALPPPTQQQPSTSSKLPFRPRKIRKTSTSETTTITNSEKKQIPTPKIISRTLSFSGEIEKALKHLRSSDPLLIPIIDQHQPPTFDSFHPPFLALSKSILYQQLAFKAGTSIYTRFVSLCGGESGVSPDAVLSLSSHQLRQIGVSARKASYLHDLASKYRSGILSDGSIVGLDDKSLFTMLTMVKGIGSWSVHMFMIFSLHRPDVLPIGDLGVRKGVQLLYGLEQLPRPSQMEQLCEKWKPYRSVASWYMWRFAETKGAPPAISGALEASDSQVQQQQRRSQTEMQPQPLDQINSLG
ncbi:hypothetical protein IFM89_007255 [Coptis chinensis]|uniref:HhH-GPD domain-containing protein n=1 Tax=Coptis chinensis TaxID=261450 RepID=A0A835M7Q4_9MAGN|nr:hypothetical protein IFM89_007255 [Coptis chinensis]